MQKMLAILILSLVFLPGCALKPTRYVFREGGPDVYYMSKEKIPFKATVHGINWHTQQVKENTIVLARQTPSPAVLNFYEYTDNSLEPKYFKRGYSDARSLKAYTDAEFHHYNEKHQAPQMMAENLAGALQPNTMWNFTSESGAKVYNISVAKDDHLITISFQGTTTAAPEELKEIFRSIVLLSKSDASKLIESVEDKNNE